MTEKPRILPVDPLEAARTPVEGVGLPEGETLKQVREGADPARPREETREESAEAAQRGRTA